MEMEKKSQKKPNNSNMPIVNSYDSSKPINLIFNEDYSRIDAASNVPWVVYDGKKIKVNAMILSDFLKYKLYDGKKIFNYIIVKSSDKSNKYHIFVYQGGVYKEVAADEFKGMIRRFIPQILRNKKDIEEVYADLISSDKFVDEDMLNSDENIINFKDGILNIKTKEFYEHSPKFLSSIQIPVNYSEVIAAKDNAPVFDKYINELCNEDNRNIEIIMECVGLCLSNIYGYRTKRALFLVGPGDSGKSQIKKLVENLLGKDNISTIDLKDLNSQFGKSAIYGKRLIGCNDMSYQNIDEMDIFKQMTGRRQCIA